MRTSKILFQAGHIVPIGYDTKPTSTLVENGVFAYFLNNGFPFYLPIGHSLMNRLKRLCSREAAKSGMQEIDIPLVASNAVLEKGENVGGQFRSKIFFLQGYMNGYHMFTTPEPIVIELASKSLTSYKQMPMRQIYHMEVFRSFDRPAGILKGLQFKTLMGHSLDLDAESTKESQLVFESMTDRIFQQLGIKTDKCRNLRGVDLEYFYKCPEGENIDLVGDGVGRAKALSLAMIYQYNKNGRNWARFKRKDGKNGYPLYTTYGFGTQRVFYATLDACRDEFGFNLPDIVRPFRMVVIPIKEDRMNRAEQVYNDLSNLNMDLLFDDRPNLIWGDKAKFADYLGIPYKVVVFDSTFSVRERGGREVYNSANLSSVKETCRQLVEIGTGTFQ
jgi:prolyl-tRNA synthetase